MTMPRQRPLRDDDYGQAAGLLDDEEPLEETCRICHIPKSRHPESLKFYPPLPPGEPTEGGI